MKKQYWQIIIFFTFILIMFVISRPSIEISAEIDSTDIPTTGLEGRNGEGWTTFEEEYAFLKEVADKSDRMTYTEIGKSVEGRPMHLVKIGFPAPPSDEDIATGRNLFVAGSHHGNEPAGREMALQLIRTLAFTDDAELIDQLKDITVLIVPTANPDGRDRNWRYNAERMDLNRDYLHLNTPETQAIAKVLAKYEPDITIDAHERPSGATPQMEMAWSRNPNIDRELFELSKEMVLDTAMPYVEDAGYTTGVYGSEGRWLPENMLGFRHSLDVVTESAGKSPPAERVAMQLRTVEGIMKFYRENFEEVVKTVEGAEARKKEADEFHISKDEMLDSVPCGYLLHKNMVEKIKNHIDILPLKTEKVSGNGVFVTMEQRMMTVIPLLLDRRSQYNLVEGLALESCEDVGTIEPPPAIEETDPAQYATDFSVYEVGKRPFDWTSIYKDSSWTIKNDPRRLEHDIVGAGNGRRALTMDTVGEVFGDVEISSVVRARNTGDTMFQVGFHMTGERTETKRTENYYYLDIRKPDAKLSPNRVRINKVENGSYKLLSSAVMPFTATENTWYSIVFKRDGNKLKAKIWPYGEKEPATFQVTVSDASFNHGFVGVAHFDSFTVNDYAFFSVGTGGETAPRPPQNLFAPDVSDGSKDKLQDVVDEMETKALDKSAYTELSWKRYAVALKEAKEVLAKQGATQAEVDAAVVALREAYSQLKDKEEWEVDKSILQSKVDELQGKKLKAKAYTKASWKRYAAALKVAEKVLAMETATQEEVDIAWAELKEAYKALEKKITFSTEEEDEGSTTFDETNAGAKLPETSSDNYNFIVVGIILILLASILLYRNKNKKLQ